MSKKIKGSLLLAIILFLALFFRIFLIDKVPPSLSNDEVDYIYEAYSLAKTGRDVFGKEFPLSFVTDQKMSPVPVYFTALFLTFLPLNSFSGRFPFALLGTVVVLLTYLVARELFKKTDYLPLIASILITISPWHLQLSRIAYDANWALFFYLLAVLLVLKEKVFLSFGPFLLAYYSYHGTKILFWPLIFFLVWYKFKFFKKNKKRLFTFLVVNLIIFFSFYFVGREGKGLERTREILFFEKKQAAEFINYERRTSSAPSLVKKIFNNKPLYYFRTIKERYFAYFNFLFNNGEESGLYSLWFRGNQYFIDLLFFVLGFYYLFKKQKRKARFLSLLLIISVLPSALSVGKSSFGTRSLVGLPFLIIVIAFGIEAFLKSLNRSQGVPWCSLLRQPPPSWAKHSSGVNMNIILLIFIYLCFFSSYLYQYYFRYPIYGAENWYFSDQRAIDYLITQEKRAKKIIFTHYHFPILMRYAISKKIKPEKIQALINPNQVEGDLVINNISFQSGCPYEGRGNPFEFLPPKSILISKWDWDCYVDVKATKEIRALDDNRIVWKIYEKN